MAYAICRRNRRQRGASVLATAVGHAPPAITALAIGNVGKRGGTATGGHASDDHATGGCGDANPKPRSPDTSRIAWTNGARSCSATTIATSFNPRPTSCPRSTSTRCEAGVANRLMHGCGCMSAPGAKHQRFRSAPGPGNPRDATRPRAARPGGIAGQACQSTEQSLDLGEKDPRERRDGLRSSVRNPRQKSLATARAGSAGESKAEDAALEIAAEFLFDVARHGPLGAVAPLEPALESRGQKLCGAASSRGGDARSDGTASGRRGDRGPGDGCGRRRRPVTDRDGGSLVPEPDAVHSTAGPRRPPVGVC